MPRGSNAWISSCFLMYPLSPHLSPCHHAIKLGYKYLSSSTSHISPYGIWMLPMEDAYWLSHILLGKCDTICSWKEWLSHSYYKKSEYPFKIVVARWYSISPPRSLLTQGFAANMNTQVRSRTQEVQNQLGWD